MKPAVASLTSPCGLPARFCVLLLTIAVAGCGPNTPPPPEKFPGLVRPSQNGASLYFKAKQQYGIIRSIDPHGPPLVKAMDGVLGLLDGAIANDPRCPLFHGKRGEILLELGPDGYERAEFDLNKALSLSEDWVPAWIALADLEIRRGQPGRAVKWLDGAAKAIDTLEKRETAKPCPPFRMLGLGVQDDRPRERDPNDPSLDDAQRRQLLMTWLQESEQWTIDSPSLVSTMSTGGQTVNQSNLIRRFKARREFELIVGRIGSNQPPGQIMPFFDRVFEWDPDLFPARIEKAVQLRRIGEYRAAERFLRPYLDSNDPKLANNARLLYEMGCIYTGWYASEPGSKDAENISKLAEVCFVKLAKVNPEHAPGWIARAELYAVAGTQAKKAATLKDAKQWLANASRVLDLKQDTPEMARIRKQIEQGEKATNK